MRIVLTRFLTLTAENVNTEVLWALTAIYVCLVAVTVASIVSLRISKGRKLAWTLLILALPVVGMVLYCARCLAQADYGFLKQFGLGPASRSARQQL